VSPDRLASWWELAGPLSLLSSITRAISKSERVIVVEGPTPRPEGMVDALTRHLGRELALDCIHADFSSMDQTGPIAHLLGEASGIPASEIAEVGDFTRHSDLADKVILVDGIEGRHALRWGLVLRSLSSEKIEGSIVGPIVIVLSPSNLSVEEKRTLRGPVFSCSTWGRVDRHDAIAHLARIGIRPSSDLSSRIGHAVMVDVAAWSRTMLEEMAQWKVDDQIEPLVLLGNLATARFHIPVGKTA
jgi:hypothetical protein